MTTTGAQPGFLQAHVPATSLCAPKKHLSGRDSRRRTLAHVMPCRLGPRPMSTANKAPLSGFGDASWTPPLCLDGASNEKTKNRPLPWHQAR